MVVFLRSLWWITLLLLVCLLGRYEKKLTAVPFLFYCFCGGFPHHHWLIALNDFETYLCLGIVCSVWHFLIWLIDWTPTSLYCQLGTWLDVSLIYWPKQQLVATLCTLLTDFWPMPGQFLHFTYWFLIYARSIFSLYLLIFFLMCS